MSREYDAAVVGGGPVGSVAAIALANRGARVVVLEAQKKAAPRFAGEWFHPTGVAVLERLGIAVPGAGQRMPRGRGFVVFPDDGSPPIVLPYPGGARASACEHVKLVAQLRQAAANHPNIEFIAGARVCGIADDGREVVYRCTDERNTNGGEQRVRTAMVVGAAGRAARIAAAFGSAKRGQLMSYMAGLELRDVELPFEGYGHVITGGLAPLLVYRFAPGKVRVCIDLPAAHGDLRRQKARVRQIIEQQLPAVLRPAVEDAFNRRRVTWTAVHFQSKQDYGHGRIALVGDSVGHFHPLTAGGLTMGFVDAEGLAQSPSLADYRKRRRTDTYVPELLSNALYQVFIGKNQAARAIRAAVFAAWRRDPREPERTMKILTGADTRQLHFSRTFFELGLKALGDDLRSQLRRGGLRASELAEFASLLQWPLAALLPPVIQPLFRPNSGAAQPFAWNR